MTADDTPLGIITRIAVKNFVTYDDVVIKPGKNLNLIIGPNGTGKSTIVSAIVLGLGGNPKVIGRAQHVGEYVKAGQKSALIEIDLQSAHGKYIRIQRSFDTQNHTTWMVNNKTANNKIINEAMKTFNIQVDNLCQFLPQDKVGDFSKLESPELLTETERSVGDPKLLEYHTNLKTLRAKQAEFEKDLENKTRLQQKEMQIYESLKDSVGHINEQKIIKKKLKTLKQKKAWILYQNKRDEFLQAKKGRDKAKTMVDKIQALLKPVDQEITKLKSSIQALDKTAKQHNAETAAKTAKLNKFLDEVERQEKCIADTEAVCEQKVKEEQERDARIEGLEQQKNKMENDLTHLMTEVGTEQKIKEQMESTSQTMKEHRDTLSEHQTQYNYFKEMLDNTNRKIRTEEQNLQAVQDIENKRLDLLRRLSPDAYKGVQWLRANKHLFSRPVHEPMLLHINLKHSDYSKYFENVISQRDLTAFVCEDKNDMNLLIKYLRDQEKLKINVVHSDPNAPIHDQPTIPLRNIQQFGFEHYLVSLIDAPRTILSFLLKMYRINEIPIGSEKVAGNLDHIPDSLFRFFSPTNSYNVSRSKYTGEKSTRQAPISSRGILSITVDTDNIKKIEQQIAMLNEKKAAQTQELDSFKEKFAVAHAKIEAVKEIRTKLQTDLGKIQGLKSRINVNNTTIANLQNNRSSIDEIRARFKGEIQTAIRKQIQFYRQYNKMLDDCYKNIIINEEMKLQIKLQKNTLVSKENDSQELREQANDADRNLRALENELTPLKDELKQLYALARESTDGICYEDDAFASLRIAFAKLPASIEEIHEEIQTTQAKIFCLNNDQTEANRILEKFNNAKKNVEKFGEMIRQKDEDLAKITEDIEKIKNDWLPMLEALVDKINRNFSNYFTKMKCAGEVSLITGPNPLDFEKYGLQIRVKFRDSDELQVLTRTHQSGGERAVTTAVYMIALQELTRVPFRCVDEINQGMDATNERRVFGLIVDITTKMTNSQYFMLTPKLLPDLKYNDSVTVLTVFNGPYMVPCSRFDVKENFDSMIEAIQRRRNAVAH